ncbi:Uu.00g109980.m01.CDS01 [Anthostomella pinea]|uniref:Uu.00g109980.m01.CDS01 n=1 Tax=Anthostomella pinea TaxID=933095 RepID=A0AAI8VEU7_9PEZI|nr:Uu.00g109980.m01.CDS01 [Anthostomella pinea]
MGLFGMSIGYLAFATLHFFQFVLAITVCGLYGVDLSRARSQGKYTDGKWVYAEVVGALGALTAILYLVPFILRFAAVTVWSFILFVLWIALFGLFGSMYIHENPEGNGGIQRMKNAVWVDLANALLWLIGTIGSGAYWWTHRERNSRFTGRAKLGRGLGA